MIWKEDVLTQEQEKQLSNCMCMVQTLSYKQERFGLTCEQNDQYEKYRQRKRYLLSILRKYNE